MAVDSPHLVLDSQRIVETISRLQGRIESRFPGAGLSRICGELLLTARAAARLAEDFARPIMPLRVLIVFFVGTLAVGIGAAIAAVRTPWRHLTVDDIVQTSEAGLSEAVLVGAGLLFLIGWERRLKRSRALRAIHRLRSLAHIIDMHQLTKDPERLLNRYSLTEFSPHEAMSAFQLSRYLDYCAELLSLTGKVAAIYIQRFDDPVVLDAVGDVEDLTNGLCQKIAQKTNLLHSVNGDQR